MSKLHWDDTGKRYFELGVKKCVLFKMNGESYKPGVAWSGVTNITEKVEGAEENAFWADGLKYASLITTEDFKATLEAYQCPPEFYECEGIQSIDFNSGRGNGLYATNQNRARFGLCYTTTVGSDTKGVDGTEKIHLIYNASAAPSERSYATLNQSPDAMTLSWDITTKPMFFSANHRPSAHFVIDTSKISKTLKSSIEKVLYGTNTTAPTLPAIYEWQKQVYKDGSTNVQYFTVSLQELLTYPVLTDASGNIVVDKDNRAVLMH